MTEAEATAGMQAVLEMTKEEAEATTQIILEASIAIAEIATRTKIKNMRKAAMVAEALGVAMANAMEKTIRALRKDEAEDVMKN